MDREGIKGALKSNTERSNAGEEDKSKTLGIQRIPHKRSCKRRIKIKRNTTKEHQQSKTGESRGDREVTKNQRSRRSYISHGVEKRSNNAKVDIEVCAEVDTEAVIQATQQNPNSAGGDQVGAIQATHKNPHKRSCNAESKRVQITRKQSGANDWCCSEGDSTNKRNQGKRKTIKGRSRPRGGGDQVKGRVEPIKWIQGRAKNKRRCGRGLTILQGYTCSMSKVVQHKIYKRRSQTNLHATIGSRGIPARENNDVDLHATNNDIETASETNGEDLHTTSGEKRSVDADSKAGSSEGSKVGCGKGAKAASVDPEAGSGEEA